MMETEDNERKKGHPPTPSHTPILMMECTYIIYIPWIVQIHILLKKGERKKYNWTKKIEKRGVGYILLLLV